MLTAVSVRGEWQRSASIAAFRSRMSSTVGAGREDSDHCRSEPEAAGRRTGGGSLRRGGISLCAATAGGGVGECGGEGSGEGSDEGGVKGGVASRLRCSAINRSICLLIQHSDTSEPEHR